MVSDDGYYIWLMMVNDLVGGIPTPLKNKKSVGMITFPTEWRVIKFHGSKPPIRTTLLSACGIGS